MALGHEEVHRGQVRHRGVFSGKLRGTQKPRRAVYGDPGFPNRKFRQSYIFVPENSPLNGAEQLKGKKVGIPGWLNTAGLWARGILATNTA